MQGISADRRLLERFLRKQVLGSRVHYQHKDQLLARDRCTAIFRLLDNAKHKSDKAWAMAALHVCVNQFLSSAKFQMVAVNAVSGIPMELNLVGAHQAMYIYNTVQTELTSISPSYSVNKPSVIDYRIEFYSSPQSASSRNGHGAS